ncbi:MULTISPECIES: hypothetical protein [Kordiimonas]|jgi:hypothetical protein|uniref:hypothetical protein n=1 Tax=Kordiimonas TaxID=288021 RepID=UPI00257D8032|nr:hypothetical protein [Kordiimonas sp. UBA4487]
MLRTLILPVVIAGLMASSVAARTPEEKAAETAQAVTYYLDTFRSTDDEEALARAYSGIARTWEHFSQIANPIVPMVGEFALLHARAATAARDRKRVVEAWQTALKLVQSASNSERLMALNVEAAHAAAKVEQIDVAHQFFAAARAFTFTRGENADSALLYMRIRELSVLGSSMQWRNLNDALTDMRAFSEKFPMWSVSRLEAVLAETEIRLQFQPEETEKRADLSRLKAEIRLIADGLAEQLPSGYLARVRQVNYALEDNYNL